MQGYHVLYMVAMLNKNIAFCICFAVLFLSIFIVRLHDQSSSSDEVGGLLQVLQAPI